jgi:hypothetical protein
MWSGRITVAGVQHRRPYDAPHRLSPPAQAVRELYTWRQASEEFIKVLKAPVSLEAWQAGDTRSPWTEAHAPEGGQAHHLAWCVAASLLVERERVDQGLTPYQLRRPRLVRGLKVS